MYCVANYTSKTCNTYNYKFGPALYCPMASLNNILNMQPSTPKLCWSFALVDESTSTCPHRVLSKCKFEFGSMLSSSTTPMHIN